METMKADHAFESQQHKKQPQQNEEEMKEKCFHVLAVDDSQIERKMLEKLLTVSSYQVTSVESGDKALEYLGLLDASPSSCDQQDHGMRVNLIMTDYSMPGMTGYDLLKKVKGSSWRDVPVIVMSSENVPSRIHMCLEEGAEEFMLKPVRLTDLKKLQPYITRSLRCCCDNNGGDSNVGFELIEENLSIEKEEEEEEKDLNDECGGNFGNKREETIVESKITDSANCSD